MRKTIFVSPRCQQFIDALDKSTRVKITRFFVALEKYQHELSMPYARKITNELFELRIRGKQEVRLLYVFVDDEIAMLHGFVKKTPKIPKKEIQTTLKRLENLTKK